MILYNTIAMKYLFHIIVLLFLLQACEQTVEKSVIKQPNWENRKAEITNWNGYETGKTYLPVYSHIYQRFENRTFNLTVTVSIRNTSPTDSIFVLKADYFDTRGDNIRQYLKSPVFLKPMETIELVIEEDDREGGSGANFLFDWAARNPANAPLFEAVMISTYGSQGLSFLTRGVPVDAANAH